MLISDLNFMMEPVEVTTVAEEPATATRSLLEGAMTGWLGDSENTNSVTKLSDQRFWEKF